MKSIIFRDDVEAIQQPYYVNIDDFNTKAVVQLYKDEALTIPLKSYILPVSTKEVYIKHIPNKSGIETDVEISYVVRKLFQSDD